MIKTNICPRNQTVVERASKILGCGSDEYGNNQYLCLPNAKKTSLVQFCVDGLMEMKEKGTWRSARVLSVKFSSSSETNKNIIK